MSGEAAAASPMPRGGRRSRKTQKRMDYQANQRSGGFTVREIRTLQQYLEEYRQGAWEAYQQQQGCDSITATPPNPNRGITIAGIPLPPLTHNLLAGPHLAFPSDITAKQRKSIHNTCADLGLYHCAIGENREQRYMAVSIYYNVFPSIPGFQWETNKDIDALDAYRPWICRPPIRDKLHATKRTMREKVQQLIDQPGTCLREEDGLDTLDMDALKGKDLSQTLPPRATDSGWELIDTPEKMARCIQELTDKSVSEIGFDLEAFNPNQYCQRTCLLQLTSNLGKEYIIDTLATGVWDCVHDLAPLFADPAIVKIGHAVGGLDVRSLYRDFGITVINVFDTYEAAKVLNLPSHGLAAVCQYYGLSQTTHEEYSALKETHQTMDWRERPLSQTMILYGRYDVHYLLALRELLMRDLVLSDMYFAGSYAGALQQLNDMEDNIYDDDDGGGGIVPIQYYDDDEDLQFDENGCVVMTNGINNNIASNSNGMGGGNVYELETNGHDNNIATSSMEPGINDHHNNDNNMDLDNQESNMNGLITVDQLRMQPQLMTVLTESQYRCRSMAKSAFEFHFKNALFVNLLLGRKVTKGKKGHKKRQLLGQHGPWTKSQIILYESLAHLRLRVADEKQCLPGFICSLDELALIAAGRPSHIDSLRIIDYYLPERFGRVTTRNVLRLTRKSLQRDRVNKSPFDASMIKYKATPPVWSMSKKLALGTMFVGGVGLVALSMARRKHR